MTKVDIPFRLIGVCGRMGAGKDTIGRRLVKQWGYVRYAFADPLKEVCAVVMDKIGVSRSEIGWTGEDWTGPKSDLGRWLLQGVGHGVRTILDKDIWVEETAQRIDESAPQYVVLTDVRYPNEARFVKSRYGILIRVTNPRIDRSGPEHQDPTEKYIDQMAVDYEVINDKSVLDLYSLVDDIVGFNGDF